MRLMSKTSSQFAAGLLAALLSSAAMMSAPVYAQDADEPQADSVEPREVDSIDPAIGDVDGIDPAVSTVPDESRVVRRQQGARVMDELELDRTTITGNQELPKVLYIVPWKQADLGDLVGRPVNSLLDEALQPVDRDVFRRQMDYYDDLYGAEPAPDE